MTRLPRTFPKGCNLFFPPNLKFQPRLLHFSSACNWAQCFRLWKVGCLLGQPIFSVGSGETPTQYLY